MPRAAAAVTCRSRLASHAAEQDRQEVSFLANEAVSGASLAEFSSVGQCGYAAGGLAGDFTKGGDDLLHIFRRVIIVEV